MLARRSRDTAEVAPIPPADAATPQTPAQMRASADAARTAAQTARTTAEQLVTDARTEADRLIAQARLTAQQLGHDARAADREAEQLTNRAASLEHAEALREQITGREQQAIALAAEAGSLYEQGADLDRRLTDLGVRREDTGARLATARDTGNVAAVAELRTEMSAVDEVVSALTAQLDAGRARVAAIGEPDGGGELAAVLGVAAGIRAQLRQTLNFLDPDRAEARLDWITAGLAGVLTDALTGPPAPSQREVIDLGYAR